MSNSAVNGMGFRAPRALDNSAQAGTDGQIIRDDFDQAFSGMSGQNALQAHRPDQRAKSRRAGFHLCRFPPEDRAATKRIPPETLL